jgi:tryptophanyl-tRNA synthetase
MFVFPKVSRQPAVPSTAAFAALADPSRRRLPIRKHEAVGVSSREIKRRSAAKAPALDETRSRVTVTAMENRRMVVLTGDRPTGQLHLGHYVGSLRNRVEMQERYKQYVMIADVQALTDYAKTPAVVRDNVIEVAFDYVAAGLDPQKTTIVVQSLIPELAELYVYLSNLVTVARVERNPTVKDEIRQKGMGDSVPFGFFGYPVSQVADITGFRADVVPVGEDQKPMIELTNEIVHRFNQTYGGHVLREVEAIIPSVGRLPSIDGKGKMSKSLGNTITLDATDAEIAKAVHLMYTDPNHLRVADPGQVEGNVVFTYLDAFDPDTSEVARLKEQYRAGGMGDSVIKKRLTAVLSEVIRPMRERRNAAKLDPAAVIEALRTGTEAGRSVVADVLSDVKRAMKIDYLEFWKLRGWSAN